MATRPLAPEGYAMVKTKDGYDAARVLLLPALLDPGEALLAIVSDEDTLVYTSHDDADSLAEMATRWHASAPPETRLIGHVLRVTNDAIERA